MWERVSGSRDVSCRRVGRYPVAPPRRSLYLEAVEAERQISVSLRLQRLRERVSPDFSGRQEAADTLLDDLSEAVRRAGFLAEWRGDELTVLVPSVPRLWIRPAVPPLSEWRMGLEGSNKRLVPPVVYDPLDRSWKSAHPRGESALEVLVTSLEALCESHWRSKGRL